MSKYGSVFCMIYSKSTDRFLFEFRGPEVGNPNTWGLFGGSMDAGESKTQAMTRELLEETGFKINSFDLRLKITPTVTIFAKTLKTEQRPKLSWESESFAWAKSIDAVTPLHKRISKYKPVFLEFQSAIRHYAETGKVL